MLSNLEKYRFKRYDKRFPRYYQQERLKLIRFLAKTVHIEHIGSTAVPGLGGKGIVDILIGDKEPLATVKRKLVVHGYVYIPQRIKERRLFFRKDYTYRCKTRRVHIHLVRYGSPAWHRPIKITNTLRKNPKLKKRYANVKKHASRQARGNIKIYKKKDKFLNTL